MMNCLEKVACPRKPSQIVEIYYVSVVVCSIVVHNPQNLCMDNYILDNTTILK